jgi:hypothetical protein
MAAGALAVGLLAMHECVAQVAASAESSFNAALVDGERVRLQAKLREAAVAFDAALAAGDAPSRRDWHSYLRWDKWAAPLISNDACELPEMKRVAWRLYAAKDGFENSQIVALRDALSDLVTLEDALAAARGDLAGEYQRRLAMLHEAAGAPTLDFAKLEEAAWWLAVTRQAPAELKRLRAEFNQPVIVFQVHRDLVESKLATFERTSQEQRPTRQRIQGATVVGTASVDSRTTAALVEDAPDVRLRIITRGEVVAPHNVTNSGRVSVSSSSNSQFTVSAEVYWDGERFAATEPHATADMQTAIKSISAPRLIRRAAERRIRASRGAAQAEAETLVARQAEESMAPRLATAVDKLNQKSANFLGFMTRTGNTAANFATQVRPTSVQVGYMPTTYSGLGARLHEVPALAGEETLGLSFHDAGLESILRAQVAGKTWTDVNFAVLQRELTGGNSQEHMVGLDPQRWSVQWSWRRPVSIHFTPEFATVCYRYDRAEIDGAAYEVPFEVRARMTVSAPPLGFEMRLLEPASVVSLDPERPLPPHFQAFLEHKFRGLFGERFSLDGMQFPAGGALDGMSAFRVASASLEANWVHLRYTNRQPKAELVKTESATPATP